MIVICLALQILVLLVLAYIVVSWFPRGGDVLESVRGFLALSTEWLLAPLRRVIPPVRIGAAALDLSPLVVIIGAQILLQVIC